MATLFLIVGLPGAGKTTLARELAVEQNAVRLTPDAWMLPLFGAAEADGKRDVLEGRLIWLAFEALRVGASAILDFGFWGRNERASLRWLAAERGAACRVIYLPVDRTVQLERIRHRHEHTPQDTVAISETEIDAWSDQFEPPDADELAGGDIPGPPTGWSDWARWAATRWPSSSP